jgi:hypothetical protein
VVEAREERAPLSAHADEADANFATFDRPLHHRRRAEGGDGRHPGDRLEKVSAAVGHLFRRQVHVSISSVAPL